MERLQIQKMVCPACYATHYESYSVNQNESSLDWIVDQPKQLEVAIRVLADPFNDNNRSSLEVSYLCHDCGYAGGNLSVFTPYYSIIKQGNTTLGGVYYIYKSTENGVSKYNRKIFIQAGQLLKCVGSCLVETQEHYWPVDSQADIEIFKESLEN